MRLVSIVVLAACTGSSSGPGGGPETDPGPDASSGPAGSDGSGCGVAELFASRCVLCHSPEGGTQGSLDLSSDPVQALVDRPSAAYPGRVLVVPGDPDGSFLVAKVSGAQGDDGDPMPLPSGLEDAGVHVVRRWVADGAPACEEGATVPPGAERYHPSGWVDPATHGLAAKLQEEACTSCHGADLAGGTSGVSCDTCHEPGWRTTCTYCHGGVDNLTGAPPENIDDSPLAFEAHTAHVEETIHPAYDCQQCHREPSDPLTPGHVLVDDDTPGAAEVEIPGATWSAGTCSDVYCHGDGRVNGVADATFVATCDGCHADASDEGRLEAMSGQHHKHVWSEGFACAECHPRTVDASGAIVDPTVHVDGAPTVAPTALTWDPARRTCDGTCHGETHSDRSWD